MLQTYSTRHWDENFSAEIQKQATTRLENGQVIFFPELDFSILPEEKYFLSSEHADPHSKNISYLPKKNQLWGVQRLSDNQHIQLKSLLDRFSKCAHHFICNLLPAYADQLIIARTSFRPIQISGRKSSYRKDDTRLHIDAFPSAPNQGKRILRLFSNVNPYNEDRVWRLGEAFTDVAKRFLPQVPHPIPGVAGLLRLLRITKSYRTAYDHYMLHIHNMMKADEGYQREALQQEIRFPPGSTWIVQTDHVSHAAMQGQFVLEQTFYLPVSAMENESQSPLRILERILDRPLA